MPKRQFSLTTEPVELPGAHGVVFDDNGFVALMCRGRGVRARLSTESAEAMIQGLMSVLPDLADSEQRAADNAAAELATIVRGDLH